MSTGLRAAKPAAPWRAGRVQKLRTQIADDATCGWLETLPPPSEPRRLAGDQVADCAVIGAGFTGLAAARRLTALRPDWRVVILDAQRAGYGASGRSSGFVVDLAGFIATMAPDDGERFIRLSRFGIGLLRDLTREHDIDCDWHDRGWLHVAAGDTGMKDLGALRDWLAGRGEAFEWLDDDGMAQLTGSPFYRAGLRLPGSVLVQAGALVRGLAASLPEAVTLWEESPVRCVERWDGSYLLHSDGGTVRAEHLVVATNGYAPALGFLARRVFPLITFGSLTRPLTAEEQEAVGGEREWGLLAQDPMGSSVRRTRDQRLLIRNHLCYRRDLRAPEALRERVVEMQRAALLRRYPMLAAVPFAHTWSGIMGATVNRTPFFGFIADKMVAAGGFTGAGIAMGTACGVLLAELVTATESPRLGDMLRLPAPRWVPPEPFCSLGIGWRVARMNAAAGDTL